MRLGASSAAALGFAGGFAVGLIVWNQQTHRYRQDLFSSRRGRRMAALGYVHGRSSPSNVLLLRDYVRWEQDQILRARGQRILRQMEHSLD